MIVELLTFRPTPGTPDDAVRAADQRVQVEFALLQPGILRWTTTRAEDGEWLVVSLWESAEAAAAAEAAATSDPAASAFAALVDPASVRRRRYEDVGG